MPVVLPVVFALSGAAALLFETLWFRQAGLALGNSVWASSLITASFMAGLAAGNGACARWGRRIRRPIRAYAVVEVVVAVTGVGIVLAVPHLVPVVATLSQPLLGQAAVLNTLRLAVAFALFAIPATAMGTTLPLLVEALAAGRPGFGPALGRLYGWNTLGAVGGALLGELALIEACGVRGTAMVAGFLDLVAAAGALAVARGREGRPGTEGDGRPLPGTSGGPAFLDGRFLALLGAAALAGAVMLALETVWLRFLLLYVCGTALAFATLLAVVLGAIAVGALGASVWLGRSPEAHRHAASVAFAAALAAVWTYGAFPLVGNRPCGLGLHPLAVRLVFPVCALSGVLFTLLGTALRSRFGSAIDTAAVVTVANTVGGLVGALVGGFVLLPRFGVEGAVFLAALAYGVVGLALGHGLGPAATSDRLARRARLVALGFALGFVFAVATFPFGTMRTKYLPHILAPWTAEGSRVVAIREGVTETSAWMSQMLWGQPVSHRLVTNGFSMAATGYNFDRYTRLFAYWPAALRPQTRRVLLISYGVGSTAAALTGMPGMAEMDVVDISRDVLELNRIALAGPRHPLDDPRVRVHVEDGRQFLLLTPRRYDLVTAEPPPPHNAGIVNLYSREYFQLVRERLVEGGLVTYWLPVHSLTPREAWAITAGFCDAFPDCSLWSGFGFEWMLAGTRGLLAGPDEVGFVGQWHDAARGKEMAAVGFETPDRLGATFLADAGQLRTLVGDTPPLVDDFPYRLPPREVAGADPAFGRLMEVDGARRRFQESAWVARAWPAAIRTATLDRFHDQALLNRLCVAGSASVSFPEVALALTAPPRRFTVLWMLGVNEDIVRAARQAEARGIAAPLVDHALGASALVDGADGEAAMRFGRLLEHSTGPTPVVLWRAYALCRAGESGAAARTLREMAHRLPGAEKGGAEVLPPSCRDGG